MRCLLVYIMFMSGHLHAQDLRTEFESMTTYLASLNAYELSIKYSAGKEQDIQEAGEVKSFASSEGMFYSMQGARIIINSEKMIVVDDLDQLIIYSDNQKLRKRKSFDLSERMMIGIDTLVSASDTIVFSEKGEIRTYDIFLSNSYFNLVQVKFKGKLISEVNYYYNQEFTDEATKATCKVDFNANSEFDKQYLLTSYYMSEHNGQWMASNNFITYKIVYNASIDTYFD